MREKKCTINKAMMNITQEFPLTSKHMRAQKNTGVLLNTHSHRVHLQSIELQLLCTPTHAHAFAAALCTPQAQTHTLMHRVMHFSPRTASVSQNQLSDVFTYWPNVADDGKKAKGRLIAAKMGSNKKKNSCSKWLVQVGSDNRWGGETAEK